MKHNTTRYNPAKMLTKRIVSSFYSSLRFSSLSASLIKTGDILKQARIFSSSDVLEYSKLSHDSNPLHFDIECAQNAGFEDRLVPGMLVASLFPRIIASHFVSTILGFLSFTLLICFSGVGSSSMIDSCSGSALYATEMK